MTLADKVSRYQIVWGIVGLIAGAFGLFYSRGLPYSGAHGAVTGLRHYELRWMTYNGLGATVAIALAACGVAAGALRKPMLAWIAAAGFTVIALQTLVQWRTGATSNIFGSTGPTFAFSLALALLYAITGRLASVATVEASP